MTCVLASNITTSFKEEITLLFQRVFNDETLFPCAHLWTSMTFF